MLVYFINPSQKLKLLKNRTINSFIFYDAPSHVQDKQRVNMQTNIKLYKKNPTYDDIKGDKECNYRRLRMQLRTYQKLKVRQQYFYNLTVGIAEVL